MEKHKLYMSIGHNPWISKVGWNNTKKYSEEEFWQETPEEQVLEHVGEGWHQLVRELFQELFELGWDGRITQIKEKFAGLRLYINSGTDEIFDAIDNAEDKSFKICYECGKPGKVVNGGWLITLCKEHAENRGISWDNIKV